MFGCKKCKALEDEVKHLREENLKLINRLTAIISPNAFGSVYVTENPAAQNQGSEEDEGFI